MERVYLSPLHIANVTRFVVKYADDNKIDRVKELRRLLPIGLREAVKLVDAAAPTGDPVLKAAEEFFE